MAKLIGLTGGIGSGKTTVAGFFFKAGVPIYIADKEARRVMETNKVVNAIKEAFGPEVYVDNVLQRDKVAEIVFNDPDRLKKLNAIVHPAVKTDFQEWVARNKGEALLLYESAILFEGGSYAEFDVIITVTAPLKLRIARVMQRDQCTKEHVMKRIEAQWSDEQRLEKSDYEIENIDLEAVELKTNEILKILRIKQKEL